MCVIVYKPKNKELPKKETLKKCYENNPDGSGYMFADNKQVLIKKGFMNFEEFYNKLLKDYKRKNLKNKNLIMHFRIGTSGGINKQKTHPFPIVSNENLLNSLNVSSKWGLVHNGVLSDYVYKNNTLSDTQNFTKDFIYPLLKMINYDLTKTFANKLINKELGGDKLVILNKNDEAFMFGNFIEEEGVFYSNNTYKTNKWSYYYNEWNNYKNYDDYYYPTIKTETKTTKDNRLPFDDEFDLTSEEYKYIKDNYKLVSQNEYITFEDGDEIYPAYNDYFKYYIDDYGNCYEVAEQEGYYSLVGSGAKVQPLKI